MLLRRSVVALLYSVVFSLFIAAISVPAEAVSAKVVGVTDGDTIKAVVNGTQIKIRLYGIDAPEKAQPYGQVSANALKQLTTGHNITVQAIDQDRYGRSVALVFADGSNVNEAMVRAGHAWVYSQYCTLSFCGSWVQQQQAAKSAKAGLWQDANPTPPWEWRHGGQKVSSSSKQHVAAAYSGNVNSRKFHAPGCRHFNYPNCTAQFATREQALAAGYVPCKLCKP